LKDEIEKKINFHCTKGFKKIAITRMRIKIKKNKFYIWLKSKIEKKNKFSKRTKKIQKNEDENWHKKHKQCFYWKVKLKRNNNFDKRADKKNKKSKQQGPNQKI